MKRIFYNSQYDEKEYLSLFGCGHEKCSADFSDGPGIRKKYILHYIISGEGYYEVDEQKYFLKQGDVFAIYPEDLVTYYADPENPWEFCWIIFGGKHAHIYYNNGGISHSGLVIHHVDKAFVSCITDCLKYIGENERSYSQLRLSSCILECLSHVDKATYSERYTPAEKNHVQNAIAYIEYNYGRGIGVTDIANHLGLDRSYFYKIFKKETGLSPNEYLTGYRIKRAKALISMGVDFKTVAKSIGLKDIYHFSKIFKKVSGITPSKWRQTR